MLKDTTPPEVQHGFPTFIERGRSIKQLLIDATGANRLASRDYLLDHLRAHGYAMGKNRLNGHLRDAGIREVTCWSEPNTEPLRQKAVAKRVVKTRNMIHAAITNGHASATTTELAQYLEATHKLALHPIAIHRNIRAMGFNWLRTAQGYQWGKAATTPVVKAERKDNRKRADYMSVYLAAKRARWIAEHGPCPCGAFENLVIYTGMKRRRLLWTYSDERLAAILKDAIVLCFDCHKKRRSATPAKLAAAKKKLVKIAAAATRDVVRVQQRQSRKSERLRQSRTEKLKSYGVLFSQVLQNWVKSRPKERRRVAMLSKSFRRLHVGQITTKLVREFQRERYAADSGNKDHRVYGLEVRALKQALEYAGIASRIKFLKLTIGRHLQGKAFVTEYMKKTRCVECGKKNCSSAKVLRAKDGSTNTTSGFTNLPVETIKRRLSEQLEVICQTCLGKAVSHAVGDDASDDEIKDALQSFEQPGAIVKRLHTDAKRVSRLADELMQIGVSCLCERRLGHNGECAELRMIRSSPDYVAPGQSLSLAVAIPVAVYNDDRCKGSRSCPFPIMKQGLCGQHLAMQQLSESMEDRALEAEDYLIFPDNPIPLLSVVDNRDLRNPRLKTVSRLGRWQNVRGNNE